jgi:high-affinity nickel-transport protein
LGDRPVMLGTALLAYTFGLRHAVDADHIAAIDNITRKLMQQRQRPVGVGLFFSLGHRAAIVHRFQPGPLTTEATPRQRKSGIFPSPP